MTAIQDFTFYGDRSLTRINIPNTIKSIGIQAFSSTGIVNITIPNSVKVVGDSAFIEMFALKYVNFSNDCKNIKFGSTPFYLYNPGLYSSACLLPYGSVQPTCTAATGLSVCGSVPSNSNGTSNDNTNTIIIVVVVVVVVFLLLSILLYYYCQSKHTTTPPLAAEASTNNDQFAKV